MHRVLYIDCVAGVAGDMLLGALIDAGAPEEGVREGLAGLAIAGLSLEVGRAHPHGIAARTVQVRAPAGPERTWGAIRGLIEKAPLPGNARRHALEAFRRLAEAEARIHGVSPDEVHFHEVGGADAIADICGVALAVDLLGVSRTVCSALPLGRGFVEAAHGRLPLPAPAALELLKGAPVYGLEAGAELVTPTGAALVATLADAFGPLPALTLRAVGYGAGARTLERVPNLTRVILGEAGDETLAPVVLIETNLDDLLPELVPDAAARCFAAGALDVWTTPIQMKKGRPGFVLSALARPADEAEVAGAMLRETSALGVRIARLERRELAREWRIVEVAGEKVRVKLGRMGEEVVNLAPEHDDCVAAAAATGKPVKAVWAAALAAAEREVGGHGRNA